MNGDGTKHRRGVSVMKKGKKKRFLILGIFYPAGLIAGVIIMLAIPYYDHYDDLITIAQGTADRFTEDGFLSADSQFGLAFLAYDCDGGCLDQITPGQQDSVYSIDIDSYLDRIAKNGVQLFYDWIIITAEKGSRTQLSLVATVPLLQDGTITGCFVLIRDLSLTYYLITYASIWSVLFLLLFLFLLIVHKMEARLDQWKRSYIAAMNHELKSPIASIKALSETLIDGYNADPEKLLFCHSMILKEAQQLEDTVCEILELSKLQNTKEIYRKRPAAAEEVFFPVLDRYAHLCKDIDLHFSAPNLGAAALPQLYTAPELISRVLDLLLHNATKFTEPETGEITVEFRTKRNCLEVCVRDNGCGISKEALPHIFDRFYHTQVPKNKAGSGLGLSIVREILDGLGEEIFVESTSETGTAFTFTVRTKA